MEAQKIYDSTVISLFNIVKNEKLRTKIVLDDNFKEQVIQMVNNLLFLEVEEKTLYKDIKWSPIFGKSVVNILKQKIKFEKPDNKKLEDIYADYSYTLTFCLNNYSVSRDELNNSLIDISEKEIQLNSRVSEEMKNLYNEDTKENPTVEVVDKSDEQPNQSNSNANQNFNNNYNYQGESIPIPPMQDPRFYPYLTKPKYIRWVKLVFGVMFGLTGLFYLVLNLLFLFQKQNVGASVDEIKDLFENWKFLGGKTGIIDSGSLLGIKSGQANYVMIILIMLLLSWIVYTIVAPPKRYREQFVFPIYNLIVPVIFLVAIVITPGIGGFSYIFGMNDLEKNITNLLSTQKDIQINDGDIKRLVDFLVGKFNLPLIKAVIWLLFVFLIASFASLIVLISINPRLDRQKVIRATQEYQKLINEALQGRKYQMDPTLYENQEEVDNFYRKIKEKREGRNKPKND